MAATYHPQVQPPTTPAASTTPATATTPSPSAASSPGGAGSQEPGNNGQAEQENGGGSSHHNHLHNHNNNHLNSHSAVHAAAAAHHGGHSSYVMNLVNSSTAAINAAAAAASAQCYGAASSPVPRPHEMHEMKYLPPQTAAHAAAAGLHNGHHHPALHNPWGIPSFDAAAAQAHWAMHPAAAAHSLYSQDLKQDIKPDFNNPARAPAATGVPVPPPPHHMAPHSGWNPPPPPPVSSPYLGATSTATTSGSSSHQPAAVAATTPTSGSTPVPPGHSSPSPLQHHWNGMMPPGVVPPGVHPSAFVDRYGGHRDSHNSSPGSVEGAGSDRGHPDHGMLTPTSGTSQGHPPPPSLHPADEPFGNELSDSPIFSLSLPIPSMSHARPGGLIPDDISLMFALWAFHFRRGLPPGMA